LDFGEEITISLDNTSDTDYVINKGDRIAQGLFQKYLLADDDNVTKKRVGGIGSTGK